MLKFYRSLRLKFWPFWGTVSYQIEIQTADERWAGTDANVFLQIYGVDKKTEQKVLNDRSDNFERAQKDQFKIEDIDVGEIRKIRIGHDDRYLDTILPLIFLCFSVYYDL